MRRKGRARERKREIQKREGAGSQIPAILTFALGMRPLGPSTLAALPTSDIISGVATHRSKSMLPGMGHGRNGYEQQNESSDKGIKRGQNRHCQARATEP